MRAGGMSFGAHSVNHPILSRIPIADQEWEIKESRRRIEQELGEPIHLFSYPVGGNDTCNQQTLDCLRSAGFEWAFRFGIGFETSPECDPLQIPRLAVEQTDNRTMFRAITTLPKMFD
jgi:peptidoglycan/xylan/chitin deacetylase (PgdA/CDA1 family)